MSTKSGINKLVDLQTDRVDGVDRPATGRKFLLYKSVGETIEHAKSVFTSLIFKSAPSTPGFTTAGGSTVPVSPGYGLATPDPWLRGEIGFAASGESGIVTPAEFVAPRPASLGQAPSEAVDVFKTETPPSVHDLIEAEARLRCNGDTAGADRIAKALKDHNVRDADWSAVQGTPADRRRMKTWREGSAK